MCFIRGRCIVGGGQNVSGRVILHVFNKGTLYCWRGRKYFK